MDNNGGFPDAMEQMQARRFDRFMSDITTNAVRSLRVMTGQADDERRNINDECGYPEDISSITPTAYRDMYRQFSIANRVVSLMPQQCWQVFPTVFEAESPTVLTEFEKSWNEVSSDLQGESWANRSENPSIWQYIKRADRLSGIGHFGIILLGIDDDKDLREPVDGLVEEGSVASEIGENDDGNPIFTNVRVAHYKITPNNIVSNAAEIKRKLVYLKIFDESDVDVQEFEGNVNSPRFGQPIRYSITFNSESHHSGLNMPTATHDVHWSRVIHITDDPDGDDVFVPPRLRAVWPHVLDLRKVYGGDAEGYWKNVDGMISLETHPQLGGDVVVDDDALKDMMEESMNGMQKWWRLIGMHANRLAPSISDPTPHIEIATTAICIQLGCPKRIFMGSERGELASGQDGKHWNEAKQARRQNIITPRMIYPFIDRLILLGLLPEPKAGYNAVWPEIDTLSPEEKADVAKKLTEALALYTRGDVETVMELVDYLVRIIGMTEEAAQAVAKNAVSNIEEPFSMEGNANAVEDD